MPEDLVEVSQPYMPDAPLMVMMMMLMMEEAGSVIRSSQRSRRQPRRQCKDAEAAGGGGVRVIPTYHYEPLIRKAGSSPPTQSPCLGGQDG